MSTVDLNELAKECNRIAAEHGWNDEPVNVGEAIALMHSELSEALEEYRKTGDPLYFHPDTAKPEGFGVELADLLIRVLHFAGRVGLDIDFFMRLKMQYNETRPYRHGGKVL